MVRRVDHRLLGPSDAFLRCISVKLLSSSFVDAHEDQYKLSEATGPAVSRLHARRPAKVVDIEHELAQRPLMLRLCPVAQAGVASLVPSP
jgi:hypothetical protein